MVVSGPSVISGVGAGHWITALGERGIHVRTIGSLCPVARFRPARDRAGRPIARRSRRGRSSDDPLSVKKGSLAHRPEQASPAMVARAAQKAGAPT